jgi:hypothetical protein
MGLLDISYGPNGHFSPPGQPQLYARWLFSVPNFLDLRQVEVCRIYPTASLGSRAC